LNESVIPLSKIHNEDVAIEQRVFIVRTTILRKQISSLPPYLGGKRRLIPWIFKTLEKAAPRDTWQTLTFLDAFTGGGSVSLYAKAQGFKQIYSNDWSDRSQLIIQGLLENQSMTFSKEEMLTLTVPLMLEGCPGFVQAHFSPSVFAARHADALDRMLTGIARFQSPTKQALGKLLLWHLIQDFVCMPTSIGTSNRPYAETLDGVRDWQTLNPKRFLDGSFHHLLKPTWHSLNKRRETINKGVFTGSPVQGFQMDAIAFVSQMQGDILYADPPYPGCLSYEASNRTLDSILTCSLPQSKLITSPFTKDTAALDLLFEQARHIPVWLLSYGNHQLSLDELANLIKRHCPNRQIQAEARAYKHLSHVSKNQNNQEYLVMAYS
jgi:adenine-specific DNA methylase